MILFFLYINLFSLAPQISKSRLEYYSQMERSYANTVFQKRLLSKAEEDKCTKSLVDERHLGTGKNLVSLRLNDQFERYLKSSEMTGDSLIHVALARYLGEASRSWMSRGKISRETLLEAIKNADINMASSMGSLLGITIKKPENEVFLEVLEELLREGADPNSPKICIQPISQKKATIFHGEYVENNEERVHNPLYCALQNKNFKTAQKLLKYGSNPNITLGNTQTVFQYFIQQINSSLPEKRESIFQLFQTFLEKGADLYVKNQNGTSAYSMVMNLPYVIKKSFQRIITLIQSREAPNRGWVRRSHAQGKVKAPSFVSEYKDGRNFLRFLEGLDTIEDITELVKELTLQIPALELPYLEARIGHLLQYIQKRLEEKKDQLNEKTANQLVMYCTKENYSYHILVDFLVLSLLVIKEGEKFGKELLKKIRKCPKDHIGPRNQSILNCFSDKGGLNMNHLSKEVIKSNRAVLPMLFLLTKEQAWEVYQQVVAQKGLPVYHPEKPTDRFMLFVLMMRCGSALGERKEGQYKVYLNKIKRIQEQMDRERQTIHSFKQVLPSDLAQAIEKNEVDWQVNGRSVSFKWKGKEYLFKLRKKGEIFEDGAVIQDGIEKHLDPIKRQFESPSMVHIEGDILEKMVEKVKVYPSMKNEKFDGHALFVVIKHTHYFDYLIDSKDHQNDLRNLEKFLNSLQQNVRDFSYLAHRGCFLTEIGSYSHGEGRFYNPAPFLEMPDYWNHPAGTIDDLKKHSTVSNFGQLGVRDLGNLLRPVARDTIFNSRVEDLNKKVLSQMEKDRMEKNIFSKALIEHLWQATLDIYSFFEENSGFLIDMTSQDFVNIVFDTIFIPFIEEHFLEDLHESIKKSTLSVIRPMIEEDFEQFKTSPCILYHAISRETARDHSLQNIYTAIAHVVTLVNVSSFSKKSSLGIQGPIEYQKTDLKKQEQKQEKALKIAKEVLKKTDNNLKEALPLLSKEQFIALFRSSIGTTEEESIKQYIFNTSQCILAGEFRDLQEETYELTKKWKFLIKNNVSVPLLAYFKKERDYWKICSQKQQNYIERLIWYLESAPSINAIEIYRHFTHNWGFFAPIFYNYSPKLRVDKPEALLVHLKKGQTLMDILNFIRPFSDRDCDSIMEFLKNCLNTTAVTQGEVSQMIQSLSSYEISQFIKFLQKYKSLDQFVHQGFLNSIQVAKIKATNETAEVFELISKSSCNNEILLEKMRSYLNFNNTDEEKVGDIADRLIDSINLGKVKPEKIESILVELDKFVIRTRFYRKTKYRFDPRKALAVLRYRLYFPFYTKRIRFFIKEDLSENNWNEKKMEVMKRFEESRYFSTGVWTNFWDIMIFLENNPSQKDSRIDEFILNYCFQSYDDMDIVKDFLQFSNKKAQETNEVPLIIQIIILSKKRGHTFHKKIQIVFPLWKKAFKEIPELDLIMDRVEKALIDEKPERMNFLLIKECPKEVIFCKSVSC